MFYFLHQAIQRAASAGWQSSLLNKELEKLLSSERLPHILNVKHISEGMVPFLRGEGVHLILSLLI